LIDSAHKSGDGAIGSLLLGLYKDDDTLASVGVIGAFPMTKRRELFTEFQQGIKAERRLNDAYVAERNKPPPF
jgi:ATP-dependent DNA ligase